MASCTCANPQSVASAVKSSGETVKSGVDSVNQTLYGEAMGGNPGAPAPVRFCRWAAPEITDKGESAWTNAFQAAALVIAIANGVAQGQIQDKVMDLAEGYYDMAKFKWDRFSTKYIPLEKKLLNEVSTEPVKNLNCDDDRKRANSAVESAFSCMSTYMSRKAKQLRLCIDTSIIGMLDHNKALAMVDTENYNMLDNQWFTDYSNDKRWNRRSTVLNLGRNLASEALKYGDIARNMYGQVGAQIDKAASGVIQALGYYGARNDTYYPTTYLANAGTPSGQIVSIGGQSSINPVSMSAAGGM